MPVEPWRRASIIAQTELLLDSFQDRTGSQLCVRERDPEEQARSLFLASYVVVSHGTETEPIFSYGNQAALDLWETDFDTLLAMPSSRSAEPVHRKERTRMLEQASRRGMIDDYTGIRVSSLGNRFRIERAIIWELRDSTGRRRGQAATFSRWTPLSP